MFSNKSLLRRGPVAALASAFRDQKDIMAPQVLRLVLWVSGIASLIWAFFGSQFRDAEGFLKGAFCLPVALGAALMIMGWAVTGRLKRFAFWFALVLMGQAVALQMIKAGPLIGYQHYRLLDHSLVENHPWLLVYLVLQTLLVGAGLTTRWSQIRGWVGRTFKLWQVLGVGAIFCLSSAAVSRGISTYATELLFATLVQAVNLGNIILMVWALPEETLALFKQRLDGVFGQPGEESGSERRRMDRVALVGAIWVAGLATLLSVVIYDRHPHVPDEVLYLYQARYLAEGWLTVPAPPVPEAFSFYMIPYKAAAWYSIFPPGWPAILALGVLLGVPWLVNPMLAGLNVLLAYVFVREIYDTRTARLTVLLLCSSPWYVFMGMNLMAHTFTLTCALASALAIVWARWTNKAWWALLGGGAVGVVSLIRPLDALIVAGLLGLWVLGLGGRRLSVASIGGLILGAILVGALVLPYNQQLMGDPFTSPLMAYYDAYYGPKSNALGFGPERGLGWALDAFPGHSPYEALINANLNTFSINIELLGWSTGSLLMIALLLFSRTMRRSDYLMVAAIAAVAGAYGFYWYSGGPDFGARYWYLMIIPLAVLTVRGLQWLENALETKPTGVVQAVKSPRVMVAALSLCGLALINYFPWRAVDKYHHYLRMRADVRYLAKDYHFGKSLVLIRGDWHPDYASAWIYNALDPNADGPLYAWDRNPEVRAQLLRAYADRPLWVVNGPSVTHGGFQVVAGPLSASELQGAETVQR